MSKETSNTIVDGEIIFKILAILGENIQFINLIKNTISFNQTTCFDFI